MEQIQGYQQLGKEREVHKKEMNTVTHEQHEGSSDVWYFDCGSEYTNLHRW